MPKVRRSTVRHPKFSASLETIAANDPTAEAAIEGAIWEIEHDPSRHGVYDERIDAWHAKLILPSRTDVMLYYCISPRFVMMLAIREV